MRVCRAALLVPLFVVGCHRDGLPGLHDKPAPDLAPAAPSDDLAAPVTVFDMATACRLDAPNSAVTSGGQTLGYAWLGNRDSGLGEGSCAHPVIVEVVF